MTDVYTDWTGAAKRKTGRKGRDFKQQEIERKAEKARRDALKPVVVKPKDRVRYPHGRPVKE